jgi:hypothetical protein
MFGAGTVNEPAAQTSGTRYLWRARTLVGLIAVIAAAPIVIGVLITPGGVGTAGGGIAPVSTRGFTPVGGRLSALPAFSDVPPGSGALVALVHHATTMRSAPDGRPLHRLPALTEFGSPEALWVVDHVPGWLGVLSPLAGNGRVGWIPDSAASLGRVPWELKVSLSARRLTVIEAGKVLHRYTVAVGRPDAPTPTGRFAVSDRLSTGNPSGPYGCCILALTARSPHAIQGWSGGDRIAIHSTPDTASIGQAVSHGCLRLTIAEGQWLIRHVPLGTPTLIGS